MHPRGTGMVAMSFAAVHFLSRKGIIHSISIAGDISIICIKSRHATRW